MQKEIKIKVKGIKGDKHTNEEMVELIKPLIPEPLKGQDGASPTDEKLVSLITPLIPKPVNGKTPTEEELVELFKPLLPEIKESIEETPNTLVTKVNKSDLKIKKNIIDVNWEEYKNKETTIEDVKDLPETINRLRHSVAGYGRGGGGTNITLKTNDVANTVQSELNLKAGTNMTLTPDGNGGVTFNAGGGPETQDLQAVTDIGSATTNTLEVGGLVINSLYATVENSGYVYDQFGNALQTASADVVGSLAGHTVSELTNDLGFITSSSLSDYWKSDGTSMATGNFDLSAYGITQGNSIINIPATTTVGQIIKNILGQTADLLQLQTSLGVNLSYFDKDGVANLKPALPNPTIDTAINYVLNGSPFVTGLTSWTSTGWTYSSANGGQALHTAGNTNTLSQTVSLTGSLYQTYRLTYTVSSTGVSGTFVAKVDGVTLSTSVTSGSKVMYFTTTAGSCLLEFTPSSTRTRGIYNVKIETIIPSSSLFYGRDVSTLSMEIRGYINGSLGVGIRALQNNITGNSNIGIGKEAMVNNVAGSFNIAIGENVMKKANTSFNIGIGAFALEELTIGIQNFALGYQTLTKLTSGSFNTSVGVLSGTVLTTGNHNALYGYNAGRLLVLGSNNLLLGTEAGNSIINGSFNTYLGSKSGVAGGDSSYGIIIGYENNLTGVSTENYRMSLGKFMYGRFGSSIDNSTVGFGINAVGSTRVIIKSIEYALTGTSTASDADSRNVTGVSTLYTTELAVGDEVKVYNSVEDSTWYTTIASITNDTTLTLASTVGSGGGSNFVIIISRIDGILRGLDKSGVKAFDIDKNGRTSLATGTTSKLARVGGKIKDFITSVGNIGTGEDDLYTYTTEAGILLNNGDEIDGSFGGLFISSATATRQLKMKFAGTTIFDSGALSISTSSSWVMSYSIIRVSSTAVRYRINLSTQGASLSAYTSVGEVTGLTLSNTNIIKITGESAGVGSATDDVVAHNGSMYWSPSSI